MRPSLIFVFVRERRGDKILQEQIFFLEYPNISNPSTRKAKVVDVEIKESESKIIMTKEHNL